MIRSGPGAALGLALGLAAVLACAFAPSVSGDTDAPELLPLPPGQIRAVSGDTIDIGGRLMRIERLACPDPATPKGLQAKALMNTALKAGYLECSLREVEGQWTGDCFRDGYRVKSGRRLSDVLLASGLCVRARDGRTL